MIAGGGAGVSGDNCAKWGIGAVLCCIRMASGDSAVYGGVPVNIWPNLPHSDASR